MAGCRRIELLYPPWQGGVLAAERTPQNKTHSNSARFERAWPARVNRASHWFSVNNVIQITLQLRVFGGSGAIRTPVPLAGQDVFKTSLVRPLEYTSNKNLDALFCFSHITKLAKTSHTCRCSYIAGFEPAVIHYQWICIWICCMRHVNFTDGWLWSEWPDSNWRRLDPKSSALPTVLHSE